MATGFPFLFIATTYNANYGEVLRHAEWFKNTSRGDDEPRSDLNVNVRMYIEQEMRKPAENRGEDMPRGPWGQK